MVDHNRDNAADVMIGDRVINLLALSVGANKARGFEEPKVVAHKRWGDPQFRSDIANADRVAGTRENDA